MKQKYPIQTSYYSPNFQKIRSQVFIRDLEFARVRIK